MKVKKSFNISGRGIGIFFEQQYFDAPKSPFKIKVTLQSGEQHIYEANVSFARKDPPGEIQGLFVENITHENIPPESVVEIIQDINS
jgi:hypothetical protein